MMTFLSLVVMISVMIVSDSMMVRRQSVRSYMSTKLAVSTE